MATKRNKKQSYSPSNPVTKTFGSTFVKGGKVSFWERPVKGLGSFHLRLALKGQPVGMKSFKSQAELQAAVTGIITNAKNIKITEAAQKHRAKYNQAVGNPATMNFEF